MKPAIIRVPMRGGNTPLLNLLLDPNGNAPIEVDMDGKNYVFGQVGVIPYRECIYAILESVRPLAGEIETRFVYQYGQTEDCEVLGAVDDEDTIQHVFEAFTKLLQE